ncbi:BglG family transcription antiterminator [Clostridium sp. BJN0001]|uniref:BglG family transcription antiterminator n=1 Tax=Clostridium sp. BJN0001 TaxID=2930219 RepID=UPI001FD3DD29|nr:BglG family transcription antiterminator [Clostridium sp. BJN0001]
MLSNKEKAILEVFIKNTGEIMTSKDIAENLNLSDRTIRNYIKRLQEILIENGAEITARPGHGYVFKITYESEFNTFIKKNKNNLMKKNEIRMEDSKDRQYYILNKLLFQDEYALFDDLCDELYVSRSTLSNDFSEIRKFLKSYNLSVVSKVKKGVYIDGNEKDKRHFIMDYFFSNSFSISINKYVGNTLFLGDISFEEITIIVLDECREAELKLSDYIIQNLVLHIALAIKRIRDGFNLKVAKSDIVMKNDKQLLVAKNILKRIKLCSNIEFPEEEAYYVALHLKVKCTSKNQDDVKEFNNEKKIYDELVIILEKIENEIGYCIKNDHQLINGLMTHFYPLHMRLENGVVLENPLLNEIRENYGDILLLTKHYLSNLSILKDYKVSDSEWAYICLHFMAAIERYKDNKKLNILVICATGYGSGQMLSIRLKKEFGQHINIVDVIGYYEINDEKLNGIDLIISSIDLYTVVFNVPVIHVSVFLNDKEIKEIKAFIENRISKNSKKDKSESLVISSEKKTLFEKFFKKDCFIILNKSELKEDIVKDLVNLLQRYEKPYYSEIMLRQIDQREQMSSLVFSSNIAVPHPAKSIGESARIAVAIIKDGVRWNDQFKKIKFVFLLSPSKIENAHLKYITRAIVSLTEKENVQEKLLKCEDFKDFEEIFTTLI